MKSKVGFYKPEGKVKKRFRDELSAAPQHKKRGSGVKTLVKAGAALGLSAALITAMNKKSEEQ